MPQASVDWQVSGSGYARLLLMQGRRRRAGNLDGARRQHAVQPYIFSVMFNNRHVRQRRENPLFSAGAAAFDTGVLDGVLSSILLRRVAI